MKQFPLFLILVLNIVFQKDLTAQCSGALSLQLIGSSTGGNTATTITSQPTPFTKISVGSPFTLSVAATGSNLIYRWLKDNIPMSTANAASFTVNSATSTDAGNYTVIMHGDCGIDKTSEIALVQLTPLPLTWLNFQAQLIGNNKVQLNWVTVSEINVKDYVVERSVDGLNFSSILKPINANNSLSENNYSAIDEQVNDGINYYRIGATDFDGKLNYSAVRSINTVGAEIDFKIFPNPSASKSILTISTNSSDAFDFTLFDFSGKIIYQVFKLKGNLVELSGINFASGVYLYECKTINKSVVGKIVVGD